MWNTQWCRSLHTLEPGCVACTLSHAGDAATVACLVAHSQNPHYSFTINTFSSVPASGADQSTGTPPSSPDQGSNAAAGRGRKLLETGGSSRSSSGSSSSKSSSGGGAGTSSQVAGVLVNGISTSPWYVCTLMGSAQPELSSTQLPSLYGQSMRQTGIVEMKSDDISHTTRQAHPLTDAFQAKACICLHEPACQV